MKERMASDESMNTGRPFAFAFYSAALQVTQPASVHAFSRLQYSAVTMSHLGTSRTVNILWRGRRCDEVLSLVQQAFPDAAYRGIFTDQNYLLPLPAGTEPLKIVGPIIDLDSFTDGPLRRQEPAGTRAERRGLRLITLNGRRLDPV